jgi:drug/metabolite transporter (DMT)-like permease
MNVVPFCSRISRIFPALILGQLCSVLLATCSFASTRLSQLSFFVPALQSSVAYFFLSFYFMSIVVNRRNSPWLTRPFSYYVILTLFDFFANFSIIFAFSLTSMTSAQILAGCTVPFVVFFRYVFFQRPPHLAAVALGVCGLGMIIYQDSASLQNTRHIWGDVLALVAALLYASCNCMEEFLLKAQEKDNLEGPDQQIQRPVRGYKAECLGEAEMFGMLGVLGVLLGLMVAGVSGEFRRMDDVKEWWKVCGWLGVYVCGLVGFYKLLAFFMRKYDAAVFNLSILSSGVWAGVMETYLSGGGVGGGWMYWVGVGMLWAGCGWYHWRDAK